MSLRTITAAALAAAGVAVAVVVAPSALAQPTDPPAPPSIAQLCAATGIAEVDDLLAGVARSQLVGELSPLVSLLVPDSDTVEVDASVQLADVRQALNCAPTTETPDPSATPTPTPAPTATATPTPDPSLPDPDTDGDDGGLGTVPSGAAETGDGSTE